VLTFDDGYADFAEVAVPLLERYGFRAEVFVVSELVGTTNSWDPTAPSAPLMDWDALATLAGRGVAVGSHTGRHPSLTSLGAAEAMRELVSSRRTIEERLGTTVTSIAYPYGLAGPPMQRLAGAAGYVFGYTTREWWAIPAKSLLGLPRIEVRGGAPVADFARLVAEPF
jgi:peptidoglycan/xylan/chitin deacetylase (PgdA/CDA1 family)